MCVDRQESVGMGRSPRESQSVAVPLPRVEKRDITMQMTHPPIGSVFEHPKLSGPAHTEVRPPAALLLGPFERLSLVGCPAGGHGGPAAGGRESRVEKVESRHRGPRSRGAGSGPRGVCPFGREMSVNGGCGGPVALGATGWKPIVLPAGGRLVGGVTMRKGLCRALWNPCRGSGRVGMAVRGYRCRGTPGYLLEPLQGRNSSIERCVPWHGRLPHF